MQSLIPEIITPNIESLEQINQDIAQRFHHRPVRDLAWALLSPGFFSQLPDIDPEWLSPLWINQREINQRGANEESITEGSQGGKLIEWLYELDAHIEPLLTHLKDQRATRLGIYFEQLLSFYFSHYPRFTLLAKNLQANSEKRTIGEYDFIVWDEQDQQHYHIEVAIKFYIGITHDMMPIALGIPKNSPKYNWHCWIGPNKKDSLAIKLSHLLHHQLCLSQTTAGQAALNTIGLTADQIKPKLLLTGRLYLPHSPNNNVPNNAPELAIQLPEHGQYQETFAQDFSQHSTQHFTQEWYNKKTLTDSLERGEIKNNQGNGENGESEGKNETTSYVILPRQLWMSVLTEADIVTHDELNILSSKALLALLNNSSDKDMPLHIAQLTHKIDTNDISTAQQKTAASLLEKQRFFVL